MDLDTRFHINHSFFNEPLVFNNLKIFQLGRRYCKSETTVPIHTHLQWVELTVVKGGKGIISTNSNAVEVQAGDLHLAFPYEIHEIQSVDNLEYDFFSFYYDDSQIGNEFNKLILRLQNGKRVFKDERIPPLVNNAIAEFMQAQDEMSKMLLQGIFTQIAIYLLRDLNQITSHSTSTSSSEILCYQIMNYIDTHICSIRNLETVAKALNYNYSYISALFKKTTGNTIFNYYQNKRLTTSIELMCENKKLYEIAELLGYQDQFAFSRAFKSKYGISPTNFMKSLSKTAKWENSPIE